MKSLLLAGSLLSAPPEQVKTICVSLYGAYLTGCTEEYNNKGLNNKQVSQVVKSCSDKAHNFLQKLDLCKGLK